MTLDNRPVLERAEPLPPVRRHAPIASRIFLGLCVAWFLAEYFVFPGLFADPDGLSPGTLYGPSVTAGQWWRVLTAVFEHGGVLHLFMNMSVVMTLGQALESGIGPWRLLGLSVVTALGSSACVLLFEFDTPTVGASGMILGWAGVMLPLVGRQGRRQLLVWLAQIAVLSLIPGVSWAGHLGGFLYGLPGGLLLRRWPQRFAALLPALVAAAALTTALAAWSHGPLAALKSEPAP